MKFKDFVGWSLFMLGGVFLTCGEFLVSIAEVLAHTGARLVLKKTS